MTFNIKTISAVTKDIIRKFYYWYPFRVFIQKLPFRYNMLLGRIGGNIFYYIPTHKKRLMEEELLSLFDKKNEKDFKRTVKNAFVLFCQNEIEVLLYPKLNSKNIEYIVRCSGREHIDNALSEGKGVMLLFPHFGSNQMIMPAIGYRGYKMSQLSAPPTVWLKKLPHINTSMRKATLKTRWELELSLPVTHINVFGSLKEAFRCLKRNEILGIAIDGGGGKTRVEVNFLSKRALFSTGSIEIALRTGCKVLPVFMLRRKDGSHEMIIEPPLMIKDKEEDEHAIEKNILAFVKRLEVYVLEYPCHYLNFLGLRALVAGEDGISFMLNKEQTNAESITH